MKTFAQASNLGDLGMGCWEGVPGPCLNIKTVFPRYGDSHVKDKTVDRPSYLWHGDPYTGKTTSLYWDGPWVVTVNHKWSGHVMSLSFEVFFCFCNVTFLVIDKYTYHYGASYRKISESLQSVRLGYKTLVALWNLASAAEMLAN